MSKSPKSVTASSLPLLLFLVFLTLITYINILPNQLFYDDEELIYKNAYIQNLRFLPKYFTENMIAGAGKLSNMYRPILLTSYALDYQIWGNNPFGYHLTSIILHAANSILIFSLISLLFKNRLLSFITSILFIIHPVQTEAIAYASGRTDPLFSFFSLLSIILFLFVDKISQLGNFVNKLVYIGALLFFILAILSKETAVILPLLLLLTKISFPGVKINFKKIFLLLSPFFLIDFIYVISRITFLNFANTLNFYQLENIYSASLPVRLFTFARVFFEYLSVLIFPKELIFARDIQYITNAFDPWVFAFLITFIIIFFLSIKIFSKNKLFFFSFSWFFITIAPVSGIISINSIIAQHYLYLPSLSFFLLVAYFFLKLINSPNLATKLFSTILLIIIINALIIRTIIRNLDWRDPITFYRKSLVQSPWHIPMRNNLAMAYAESGQLELAIKEYKQIILIADVYPNTHHNLANAYKASAKYQEAEEEYQKALKMDSNFFFSYYGLLDLYQKTGEKEKFEEMLKKIQESK